MFVHVDMDDPKVYLRAVDSGLLSGVPNYKGVHILLRSSFVWAYLKEHIQDYHD